MIICDRCEGKQAVIKISLEVENLTQDTNHVFLNGVSTSLFRDLCRQCRTDLALFLVDFKKPLTKEAVENK